MKTRADYDAATDVIRSVVNAWDPYALLAGGAPLDEFDAEIARLVTRVAHIHSPDDATRELVSVFSHDFDPRDFSVDSCREVGAQLFHGLERAKLLATPTD